MKNYVVWTNCDVVSESEEVQNRLNIPRCDNPEARSAYNLMYQVSRASAEKFLAGDWTALVYDDPAPSRLQIFKRNWQRIYDLWHSEPCNILYLDSDSMFVKPTELFGRFKEFRMFNWTDPKSRPNFENFYNAGVRYYPASISEEVWKIGDDMAQNWQDDNWGMEQEIFNTMFWHQNIEDHHHPELAWQGLRLLYQHPDAQRAHEEWNNCALSQAHIMHIHGSRGPVSNAQLMKNLADQVGITV
jgi:hypothetical protein